MIEISHNELFIEAIVFPRGTAKMMKLLKNIGLAKKQLLIVTITLRRINI